jgi:hypothetical protein
VPLERDHPALFEAYDGLVDQGAQLWAILHLAIARIQREVPDMLVVRHEDLSRDPIAGFRELAEQLDLPFAPRLEHAVRRATSASNPSELDAGAPHRTRLNSIANLDNWRARLTPDEVGRVRALTAAAAAPFFADVAELAAPTAGE